MRLFQILSVAASLAFLAPSLASAQPSPHGGRGGHHQQMNHRGPQARPSHNAGHHYQQNRIYSMSSDEFQALVNTVSSSTFDSDKISVISMAASSNYFTSSQAAYLMSMFTFDSEKIKVGCAVASRIVDMENWFQVFAQIKFESDRSKLNACSGSSVSSGSNSVMSSSSFQNMYSLIKAASFDDEKSAIVNSASRYNYFSTSQVVSLMNLYTFDSDKIKIACSLAPRVVDGNNWYQVLGTMTFDSDRNKLANCAP